jgi:hypothetical protein
MRSLRIWQLQCSSLDISVVNCGQNFIYPSWNRSNTMKYDHNGLVQLVVVNVVRHLACSMPGLAYPRSGGKGTPKWIRVVMLFKDWGICFFDENEYFKRFSSGGKCEGTYDGGMWHKRSWDAHSSLSQPQLVFVMEHSRTIQSWYIKRIFQGLLG